MSPHIGRETRLNWKYAAKEELTGFVFGLGSCELKKNNRRRLPCSSDKVNSELRGLEEAEVYGDTES